MQNQHIFSTDAERLINSTSGNYHNYISDNYSVKNTDKMIQIKTPDKSGVQYEMQDVDIMSEMNKPEKANRIEQATH
ncbi:MAG: hypothetical protein IM638_16000 [Bacteroidetes bacterium]|nr:hypothetical protein [Bacteroidota bacterium]